MELQKYKIQYVVKIKFNEEKFNNRETCFKCSNIYGIPDLIFENDVTDITGFIIPKDRIYKLILEDGSEVRNYSLMMAIANADIEWPAISYWPK